VRRRQSGIDQGHRTQPRSVRGQRRVEGDGEDRQAVLDRV